MLFQIKKTFSEIKAVTIYKRVIKRDFENWRQIISTKAKNLNKNYRKNFTFYKNTAQEIKL